MKEIFTAVLTRPSLLHNESSANNADIEIYFDKIALKKETSYIVYPLSDIIRCKSKGNSTTFFIVDENHPITTSNTLKTYESRLWKCKFVRVQNSHLINWEHVKQCTLFQEVSWFL